MLTRVLRERWERLAAIREWKRAGRDGEVTLATSPSNPLSLAVQALEVGDTQGAARLWEDARARVPSFILGSSDLVKVLLGLRRFQELESLLGEARRRWPWERKHMVGLAQLYGAREEFDKAAELWTRMARDSPMDVRAYINGASCLTKTSRFADAAILLRKSIRNFPDNQACWLNLAHAEEKLRKWSQALRCWDHLADHFGGSAGAVGGARLCDMMGDSNGALLRLGAGRKRDLHDQDFLITAMEIYQRCNAAEEAEACCRLLCDLYPALRSTWGSGPTAKIADCVPVANFENAQLADPNPPASTPTGQRLPNDFSAIADLRAIASSTSSPKWDTVGLCRQSVHPVMIRPLPRPLLVGTEVFAEPWIAGWHNNGEIQEMSDIGCIFASGAIVGGDGHIWIDGHLVSAAEVVPRYVHTLLIAGGPYGATLDIIDQLPIRTIDEPCLVITGHGLRVYGHFLIEVMFRILLGRQVMKTAGIPLRVLLEARAPDWLLVILDKYLEIPRSDIEMFDAKTERVRLSKAVIPELVHLERGFHPAAHCMLEQLIGRLGPIRSPARPRVFVTRGDFAHSAAPQRICLNEAALFELARNKYGFESVCVEKLPWPEQIALFRDADILLGQWGSGMHNALFCNSTTRVAVIGFFNFVQSEIGALRGHQNAFLTRDVRSSGEFSVNVADFEEFLALVCEDHR